MSKKSFTFILLTMAVICGGSCKRTKVDCIENFQIRELPAALQDEYLSSRTASKEKSLLKLWAVNTCKDTADADLIFKIDSFVCNHIPWREQVKKYGQYEIWFLKETELTKQFRDSSITDTHNPYSDEHFSFACYMWFEHGESFKKMVNDNPSTSKTPLKCDHL